MAANLDRAETSLTAVSDIAYIRGIDGSGNSVRISKADLANVLGAIARIKYFEVDLNNRTLPDLVKYVIERNPDYVRYTFIGTTQLNIQGFYVLECYDTSDVNEEGYPRYCSGIWVTANGVYAYHVTNYVYYETILS